MAHLDQIISCVAYVQRERIADFILLGDSSGIKEIARRYQGC